MRILLFDPNAIKSPVHVVPLLAYPLSQMTSSNLPRMRFIAIMGCLAYRQALLFNFFAILPIVRFYILGKIKF